MTTLTLAALNLSGGGLQGLLISFLVLMIVLAIIGGVDLGDPELDFTITTAGASGDSTYLGDL